MGALSETELLVSGVVSDLTLVPVLNHQAIKGKLRIAVLLGSSVDLWVNWGDVLADVVDPVANADNAIFINSETVAAGYWEADVPISTRVVKVLGAGTPTINVQLI